MKPPACPQCREAMVVLHLEAHYERSVEVDCCERCRLVWFDARESVNLSGLGWIDLLDRLQQDPVAPQPWAGAALGCARCLRPLRSVHNQTRYGHFISNNCPQGHGSLQSQAQLLAERGLVRAPSRGERAALAAEHRGWTCLNCGAPLVADEKPCSYCGTPPLLFDLPRLADALRPQAATRPTLRAGHSLAWPCHACGQALDPTRQVACGQCGHLVVASTTQDLRPVLMLLRQEWLERRAVLAAARRAPPPRERRRPS